jgi:hypothetical protein
LNLPFYVTVLSITGVPQLADKFVVLGGITFNKVVGAVPVILVAGDAVAVPPEMLAVVPAPLEPSSLHNVVNVSTVPPASSATCVRIKSGVYGELALFNWNIVTAAPPALRL